MTPVVDPFTQGNQRPRYIGPELRGPADADGFRVKVGRYGDRFYHDPLPGDHIAPASDWIGPAVSIVKKASGNDWSFVALERVAKALDTEKYRNLARWPYPDRYEALKAINKIGLNSAGNRGSNVHLGFDARLHGAPCPITDDMPGADYRNAIDQFFEQYNPTLVAAEFVCIHRTLNGVGYGGTADAIIAIDGPGSRRMRFIVDWKSRGADSDHGAYPEEAAQVSGYHGADYIIVEGRDGPERRLMPELDGGLIVSVKPDGCRIYPIDLDKGFAHWTALHAWWVARRDERDAIGRQWPARKIVEGEGGELTPCQDHPGHRTPSPSTPVSPQATQSPAAVNAGEAGSAVPTRPPADQERPIRLPGKAWATNDTPIDMSEFVIPAVKDVKPAEALAWASQPAPAPLPPLPANPDEGKKTGDFLGLFSGLEATYRRLDPAARKWITTLTTQAQQAGVTFHGRVKTDRRWHIIAGLVTLANHGTTDDDVLRALVTAALGIDAPLDPRHTPGAVVGSLDATAAQRFATLVDQYVDTTV